MSLSRKYSLSMIAAATALAAGGSSLANTITVTSSLGSSHIVNEGSVVGNTWMASQSGSDNFANWTGWSTAFGGGNYGSSSYSGFRTYADEGSFTISGSVSAQFWYWGGTFSTQKIYYTASGGTSTNLTVLNVAPTITSLTADTAVPTDELISFAASAVDPGLIDVLSFEWDLDGDGEYDDFAGESGTHAFASEGLYTLGLRVSDGDGGFDYGSIDVGVVSAVPLPAAATGGLALLGGLGLSRRRRTNVEA